MTKEEIYKACIKWLIDEGPDDAEWNGKTVTDFTYSVTKNLEAEIERLRKLNQELWERLTPEVRHELNKKYAALNLQSKTDHKQRTQKKGE